MDPYVYPGTDVLQNRRGLRDRALLDVFEADATSQRLRQIAAKTPPGHFDMPHLQSIHRYIFQDVYAWAGELRTVNIQRPGQFFFAFAEQLIPVLTTTFDRLRAERHLEGSSAERFSQRAAFYLGELNAAHPFRDGNGRTQREFIRQLAHLSGHSLEWRKVTRDQMYAASHRSFQRADNAGLAEVIAAALESGN